METEQETFATLSYKICTAYRTWQINVKVHHHLHYPYTSRVIIAAKQKQSKGNKFGQVIHDGVTLENGNKYHSKQFALALSYIQNL